MPTVESCTLISQSLPYYNALGPGNPLLFCLYFADLMDVLGLAVHGNYIYWTDRSNPLQPLARAHKVSGRHQETLLRNVGGLHGLVAVNKSADPGWTVSSVSLKDARGH